MLCPYCGEVSSDLARCTACGGHFDPLSRQASQNAMGPWYIRDTARPFRPGCSYETLKELVRRGRVRPETVIRGPTTHQFWTFAARAPSVANLLGRCHNCQAPARPDDYLCSACGAAFTPESDRQHLGLAPVHLLPNQAAPEMIAAAAAPAGAYGGAEGARATPRTRGATAAGRDDLRRLRRQLVAQWIALLVLFLVIAGVAAWLFLTVGRAGRPLAATAAPDASAPVMGEPINSHTGTAGTSDAPAPVSEPEAGAPRDDAAGGTEVGPAEVGPDPEASPAGAQPPEAANPGGGGAEAPDAGLRDLLEWRRRLGRLP